MIGKRDIRERLKDIETFLLDQYKEDREKEKSKRDWRTYEQRLMYRIKRAIRNLEPLIEEATRTMKTSREKGRKPELSVKQKVILLLLKELVMKSNRSMSSMLTIFSLLSGIDVSYKTVERLYSDPEVEIAIHNLHVLILKKKKVKEVDCCGDGTGYSLTIKKHYRSETEKRKKGIKKSCGRKIFAYSFKILDLRTKMYVAYGTSMRSEKQAFERATKMLSEIDVEVKSMRLDKFYSLPFYVDKFSGAKVYVIPRKNATMKGSFKWKRTMINFVKDTFSYLREYYLRNNSESGFSVDKKWFGWKVSQRREDRIDCAITCVNIWHNLLNLYTD